MDNQTTDNKVKFLQSPIFITLIALFCCFLWGSATPAIKTGSHLLIPQNHVPSTMLFAGIRFFFAGILTVVIFSIARRKFLYPKLHNLGRVGILSCFQTIIQYIFFYVGLSLTSGVKGTILSGTATFFSILISCFLFRMERFNTKKLVACILGLVGIVIINLNGLKPEVNWGDAFVIFSAISLAVSSTLIKIFSKHEDPVTLSGYQFILGGAVMIVIGLVSGGKISFKSTTGVIILIYLAFLSAIAYSLWGMLLKFNPVSKVTVFSFTTPIFGTVLSLLILTSEKPNVGVVNIIITLALVSFGILLLNYQKQSKNKDLK